MKLKWRNSIKQFHNKHFKVDYSRLFHMIAESDKTETQLRFYLKYNSIISTSWLNPPLVKSINQFLLFVHHTRYDWYHF